MISCPALEHAEWHTGHDHVEVGFLGCVDTVGSLGIPRTGIFSVLRLLDIFIRRLEFHETNLGESMYRLYLSLFNPADRIRREICISCIGFA
jgi:Uncharacterized alpha/beta hydrolase domain (DUF2235)